MGFEAELYLRLAGERALLGSGAGWWNGGIYAAANALWAVGVVERDLAQQVVDEYMFAVALREEGHAQHFVRRRSFGTHPGYTPRPLSQRRHVPCAARIALGADELYVRYVSLAQDNTRIGVTLRRRSSRRTAGHAFMHASGGPPHIKLNDDRGNTTTAHFSGGGSDTEWEGQFTADQPLAADTAWVEIEGERVELVDRPLDVEVRVEPLEEADDALRHLWHAVASAGRFHRTGDDVAVAIDALVAAGRLDADDPGLKDVRAVAAAIHEGGRPPRRQELSEPWKSLFARRRANGPAGRIAVGAVTPEFDGFSVALMSIDSTSEGFSAEVEQSGGRGGFSPFEVEVGAGRLVWWAADDRGNRYLGQMGSWSGSNGNAQGQIEFWPALDPEATRLSVMPTTEKSRCVIEFPLSWEPE